MSHAKFYNCLWIIIEMEMGMDSGGVGDCAGLHHALSALHGLSILRPDRLPDSLGPTLLRRAEQMWGLMVKNTQGMLFKVNGWDTYNLQGLGQGSDVMFIRILGILQTLARATKTHKHNLRRNLTHISLPPLVDTANPNASDKNTEKSDTPQTLLHSVVAFLSGCTRRKNSPLLRDALRSVVGIFLRLLCSE